MLFDGLCVLPSIPWVCAIAHLKNVFVLCLIPKDCSPSKSSLGATPPKPGLFQIFFKKICPIVIFERCSKSHPECWISLKNNVPFPLQNADLPPLSHSDFFLTPAPYPLLSRPPSLPFLSSLEGFFMSPSQPFSFTSLKSPRVSSLVQPVSYFQWSLFRIKTLCIPPAATKPHPTTKNQAYACESSSPQWRPSFFFFFLIVAVFTFFIVSGFPKWCNLLNRKKKCRRVLCIYIYI